MESKKKIMLILALNQIGHLKYLTVSKNVRGMSVQCCQCKQCNKPLKGLRCDFARRAPVLYCFIPAESDNIVPETPETQRPSGSALSTALSDSDSDIEILGSSMMPVRSVTNCSIWTSGWGTVNIKCSHDVKHFIILKEKCYCKTN